MVASSSQMSAALDRFSSLVYGHTKVQTVQSNVPVIAERQQHNVPMAENSDRAAPSSAVSVTTKRSDERLARREALLRAMRLAVPVEVTAKPYPETMVPLWSQEGLALLEGAVGPFGAVASHMLGQGPLQCGTTSLAVALNATRPRGAPLVTVAELHEELRAALRPKHQFFSSSLAELGALAQSYAGDASQVVYASDSSAEAFREIAWDVLEAGGVVVANFKRSELGYASPFAGHCSPLAAYNPAADEFLVMDVARKSWQPVWVPTALLFQGMDTMEKPRDEGMPATRTRGFLVVEAAGAPKHFVP